MNTSIKNWIAATRPKTLPAGAIPVLIGSGYAFYEGKFDLFIFSITLICSLLIQILTNFINELYDFKKGADTQERIGPQRQVASGNISYKLMKNVSVLLAIFTFLTGLILVYHGGLPILIIGIVSLVCAYLYTGGPFPLAYKGLGDIFVFLFFGVVAVGGTYYLQTGKFNFVALLLGFAPGFLSMNILGINNIRDIETDVKVNKLTMAVRLGRINAIRFYKLNLFLTYLSIGIIAYLINNMFLLLTFLTLIISIKHSIKIDKISGSAYNDLLADTGKLLVIFGLLETIGFIIGKLV